MTIPAFHKWASNAELIADAARLGHLRPEWTTLDPTYGQGVFWRKFRPDFLVGHDIIPSKAPDGVMDGTALAYRDRGFDAVVVDPPYKLNGTPDPDVDAPYGVDVPAPWQYRMELCRRLIREGARVADKRLLVKCQDQVCSGKIRWQTDDFTAVAAEEGWVKVEQLDLIGHARPQPTTRPCGACKASGIVGEGFDVCGKCEGLGVIEPRQRHAYGRPSTLLIFARS